jgi:5,10-methylenetetrahydromethanopterin reductase
LALAEPGTVVSAATISIAFQTDHSLAAYGPLAAAAEAHGFDGVSVYNDLLYQPAWPALFEIARATRRVRIGPAAMNPFLCHPVTLAGHVALLDEASQGRAYLGLARGAWLDHLGLEPARPVTALREAFECVRHLLRGDRRPYRGRVFSLAGGETLRWRVPRSEVPFLLGAWGPRVIRACAPHIDEVKVGGTASPRVVRAILGDLRAAAAQAGRPPDAVGLAVGAVSVVDRDGGAARALARQKVALYLPVIARLDPALPVEPEQVRRIEAARAAGDVARAGREVPDAALRSLALAGTPDKVAEQALELYAAGARRVEFGMPHGLDEAAGVRLLGEVVLPSLRRQGIGAAP